MIPQLTNRNRNRKDLGVTLIECLVVISIMAGLIAAVGSSFTMSLKSYVGEYSAEGSELESQRAALELEYFASRAVDIKIIADPAFPSTTDYSSGYLGGTRVELRQPDDSVVAFQFRSTNGSSYTAGVKHIGQLGINIDGNPYVFTKRAQFVPSSSWRYPFQVSTEGGLAFRWTVPTPASGDINVGGSVNPGL